MIHLQNICFEIEKFCDVKLTSSEHVDTRPSRIAGDNEDVAKLSQWLSEHNPFPKIDVIMSIASVIVGGNEVNCHLSEEIGRDMISKMMGGKFENVKFKWKGKVLTLASINSSVKISNISIVVDPHILFHRLCIAKQSDDDLKAFFKCELSPFPILLFTGESMRKGTKSSLYTTFSPITEDVKPEGSQYVVVDGGHLLHKIVWRQQATFGEIADRYLQYLNNKYGQDIAVIFDAFPDDDKKSTKNCERLRRAAHFSPDVMFHEETVLQYTKEKLLANECNKKRFMELLNKALQKANICVQQAVEDADLTIVNTAISVAPQYDYGRVVGEDIDLLVLLTALASTHSNGFFQKCGRGKTPDSYYSTTSFNHKFSNELLFIYAISGCDITSALFGQGKNKFISLFLKHEEILNRAATFLNSQATTEQVTEAGEYVLVALYGGDPATQNLDELRYHSFVKAAAKTKFNLARLPPTTDAAQLHAMRSYHQVQTWLGNEKDPLKWGWMHTPSGLFPKKSEKDPAPESLLQCISCTCKKGCTNACGRRKAGLHCSLLCKHCIG
ncbi:hypothetical protein AVEN_107517-1 [Araneus ventricosus]|uniref:Uncharacterized protein n=1 Tax=Araneus ventricosus TaxID=182803 RepID=A0A4Y2DM33_ARAVE|nr:hypothetical protein AVEN_107517-1 [Araneus ventricosus]